MFRTLLIYTISLLLTSCGGLLYPGNITLPHLENAGDWQVLGNVSFSPAAIGGQAQIAHAINDDWGVQATAQILTTPEFNLTEFDRHYGFETGVIRMLKPLGEQHHGSTYMLQAGLGYSRSSLAFSFDPALQFGQTHLFTQAHSRTMVSPDLGFSFGLRLAASSRQWLQEPVKLPYSTNDHFAIDYLNHQQLFFFATPLLQGEYNRGPYVVTFTIQPTYVINQADLAPPTAPLTFGIRWNP